MGDYVKSKKTLELSVEKKYLAPQGICLPLAVILSENKLLNWYYLHYMYPIARLDSLSSLSCGIVDGLTYGSSAKIYNKIIRSSSMNVDICKEIRDIVNLLKRKLEKDYYCILFLDCSHLINFSYIRQKQHHIHELLFYGYDDYEETFECYGYIEQKYQCFKVTYAEVYRCFFDALKYIGYTDGWEEYMLITLQKVGHTIVSPYSNKKFLYKLNNYVVGAVSEDIRYEELLYLNTLKNTIVVSGINITDVFCEYINLLRNELSLETLYNKFVSQLPAMNMYKFYHVQIFEKLEYFIKMNELENELNIYLHKYNSLVVKQCELVRILYLKLCIQIQRALPVERTLDSIYENLVEIKQYEKEILQDFINISKKLFDYYL